MAQCVWANPLSKPGAQRRFVASMPDHLFGDGTLRANRLNPAWEQINARLVLAPAPVLAQTFKQPLREGQVAIARTLALMYMDQHERGIDIALPQLASVPSRRAASATC